MLVSLDESARLLGVHRSTLERWAKAGRLPLVRLGGRVLVRRATLEALVDEAERGIANPEASGLALEGGR